MVDWYDELSDPASRAIDWYQEVAPQEGVTAGKPLGAGPIVADPSRMAGTATQLGASLPTDTVDRVRYYASQRFPGMPIDQAMSRYGVERGRIFYVGDDGGRYFEEPQAQLPTTPAKAQELAGSVVGNIGDLATMAGGVAGGLATTTYGGGVPGAAGGAALVDIGRQALSKAVTGEEKEPLERMMQTGLAAGTEGLGQLAGLGIARFANRFGTSPTYNVAESSRLADEAQRRGIHLTPAELTGGRAQTRRQKVLARTSRGEDIFSEFYQTRNEDVRRAMADYLTDLSLVRSVREGQKAGVAGAEEAIKAEMRALQKQASPYYETAFEKSPPVNVDDALGKIDDLLVNAKGKRATNFRKIKKLLMTEAGEPETNLKSLHDAKLNIDEMLENPRDNSIGRTTAKDIRDIKDRLVSAMREASPDYEKGRSIYEEGFPPVTELKKGVVGDLAKLEGRATSRAAQTLFSHRLSSPEDVAIAREAFWKAGQQDQWNALIRAHLEESLENIPESSVGGITNLGGIFAKAIWGTTKKRRMMEEALKYNPEMLENLEWTMKVLRATGRAMQGESWTASAQTALKEFRQEARGLESTAMEALEFWRTPSRLANFLNDLREGRHAQRLSELYTTPGGQAELRKLRQIKPGTRAAVLTLGHLIVGGGLEALPTPSADYAPTYDAPANRP